MKRALPVAAFVLLGGLVAGLVLALTSGSSHPTSPATSVRAQLLPRDPQFGDTVVATLDVPASSPLPGRVDFRPYTVVSKKTSSGDGRLVVTYRLGCLDQPCVPHAKAKVFRFKPAVWPPLRVHSRLAAADAAHPIVRVPPPVAAPVHYRVSPTATGIVLLVLAAVLAVAGAVLLLRVGLMRVGAARPKAPPLEQVLAELAASCSNGSNGRRRRALESLARELEPLDPSLSAESRVLAWGPSEPSPDAISDLTERVRNR